MAHPSKPQAAAAAAPDKKRSTKGSSSNRNKSPMARIRGRSSGEKKYEGRKAPSAPQRESSKPSSSSQQQNSSSSKSKQRPSTKQRTKASDRIAKASAAPWSEVKKEVRRKSRDGAERIIRRLSMTKGPSSTSNNTSNEASELNKLRAEMKKKKQRSSAATNKRGGDSSKLRSSSERRLSDEQEQKALELKRLREERKKQSNSTNTAGSSGSGAAAAAVSSSSNNNKIQRKGRPSNSSDDASKVIKKSASQEEITATSRSGGHRSASQEPVKVAPRPRMGGLERQMSQSLGHALADKDKSSSPPAQRANRRNSQDNPRRLQRRVSASMSNVMTEHESEADAKRRMSKELFDSADDDLGLGLGNTKHDDDDLDLRLDLSKPSSSTHARRKNDRVTAPPSMSRYAPQSAASTASKQKDRKLDESNTDAPKSRVPSRKMDRRYSNSISVDLSEKSADMSDRLGESHHSTDKPSRVPHRKMGRRMSNSMGAATMSKAIAGEEETSAKGRSTINNNRRSSLDSSMVNLGGLKSEIKAIPTSSAANPAERRRQSERRRNSLESSMKIGENDKAAAISKLGDSSSSNKGGRRRTRSKSIERKKKGPIHRRRSFSRDCSRHSQELLDELIEEEALDDDLLKIEKAFSSKEKDSDKSRGTREKRSSAVDTKKDKASSSSEQRRRSLEKEKDDKLPSSEKRRESTSSKKLETSTAAESSEQKKDATANKVVKPAAAVAAPSTQRKGSTQPMTEREKKMKEAFAQFDVDGSGTIDKFELHELMKRMGITLSSSELNTMMREADRDGNGEIDFNEFKVMMNNASNKSTKNTKAQSMWSMAGRRAVNSMRQSVQFGRSKKPPPKNRHTSAPVNRSKPSTSRNTAPARTAATAGIAVAMMSVAEGDEDEENDSTATPSAQRRESTKPMTEREKKMKEAFAQFDVDGSGTIDKFELHELMKRMGITLSSSELNTMMLEADRDGNGEIDFNEFKVMMNNADEYKEDDYNRIPLCCGLSRLACCTLFLCYILSIVLFTGLGFFINMQFFTETNSSSSWWPFGDDNNGTSWWPFGEDINGTMSTMNVDNMPSGIPSNGNYVDSEDNLIKKQADASATPSSTNFPSYSPSYFPSSVPSTSFPSSYPSVSPTVPPSESPSISPTASPSISTQPTVSPSFSPSSQPTGIPGCPNELLKSVALGDDDLLTLNYEIVEYQGEFGELNGGGLLCAMLDYTGTAGWMGVAFSEAFRNPKFGRKEAIIGIPGMPLSVAVGKDDGVSLGQQLGGSVPGSPPFRNPAKYLIEAGGIGDDGYSGPSLSQLYSPEKQTLMNGSTTLVTNPDGQIHTQMYFTKILREPDEIEIDPYVYTLFLYNVASWDGSGEYDGNPEWKDTTVNFLGASGTKSSSVVRRKRQRHHSSDA